MNQVILIGNLGGESFGDCRYMPRSLERYLGVLERHIGYSGDNAKSSRCTISKDLPTDIGGSDVAICGEGAPVAASSEDDDGGGGDDPDSDRRHSSLPSASRSRAPQLLRLADVKARTGLSRTTIYRFIADGRFPRNFPIGARAVAWLESDITQWIVDHANAHMLA